MDLLLETIPGWQFSLFAGAVQGLVVGSVLIVYRKKTGSSPDTPLLDDELDESGEEIDGDPRFRKAMVPFGPFLALGAIEYYFSGEAILSIYLEWISRLLGGLI